MHELPSADAVFFSGSGPDESPAGPAGQARSVRARKLGHAVYVRFADDACPVETLEGVVGAMPGDAIVTGRFGERWPVGRAVLTDKYEAVAPVQMGGPGRYLSLPIEVDARLMAVPFEVVLSDGASRLHGRAGDWLVDYRDGSLGIVDAAIFAATYAILEES